jgi:O-antigen/teichoic acid export membrane protein
MASALDHNASGLRARLALAAISAFSINAAGVGLAFGAQLLAARVLGAENYGIYAYVVAWVTVLGLLATLGFESAILRFAAVYESAREWGRLRGAVAYAESRAFVAALAITLAGLVVTVFLSWQGLGAPALLHSFMIGLVAVPCLALLRVRSSVLRAFGRIAFSLLPDRMAREGTIIVVLGVLSITLAPPLSAPLATAAFLIGALVGLGLAARWIRRARPPGIHSVAAQTDQRGLWLRTALPLLLVIGSQFIMTRIDVVLLGSLVDTKSAGVFNVASLIAQIVVFPLMAIHALFHPTIAALHAQKEHDRLQELTTTTAWWSLLAGFAFGIPVFVSSGHILALFGVEFSAVAPVLRILLVAHLLASAAGSIVALISMTGNERLASVIMTTVLAIKIVAGLVFIPRFGVLGAAIVDAVAIVTWNVAFGYAAWSRLRLIPSIFGLFLRKASLHGRVIG